MLNKKLGKKLFLSRPGNSSINAIIHPRTTQAQLEIKKKQELKIKEGGLSELWLKSSNTNRLSCLDNILVTNNKALNLFHAKQLIKDKNIKINNKFITNKNYIIKPFSTITFINKFKELILLNKMKEKQLKNNTKTIEKKCMYLYKPENFNPDPLIKKFR